jgi:hypothetical protein
MQNPVPFAALVGIDWADKTHDVCLWAADSTKRERSVVPHTPAALRDWANKLRTRFAGAPIAICIETEGHVSFNGRARQRSPSAVPSSSSELPPPLARTSPWCRGTAPVAIAESILNAVRNCHGRGLSRVSRFRACWLGGFGCRPPLRADDRWLDAAVERALAGFGRRCRWLPVAGCRLRSR